MPATSARGYTRRVWVAPACVGGPCYSCSHACIIAWVPDLRRCFTSMSDVQKTFTQLVPTPQKPSLPRLSRARGLLNKASLKASKECRKYGKAFLQRCAESM